MADVGTLPWPSVAPALPWLSTFLTCTRVMPPSATVAAAAAAASEASASASSAAAAALRLVRAAPTASALALACVALAAAAAAARVAAQLAVFVRHSAVWWCCVPHCRTG